MTEHIHGELSLICGKEYVNNLMKECPGLFYRKQEESLSSKILGILPVGCDIKTDFVNESGVNLVPVMLSKVKAADDIETYYADEFFSDWFKKNQYFLEFKIGLDKGYMRFFKTEVEAKDFLMSIRDFNPVYFKSFKQSSVKHYLDCISEDTTQEEVEDFLSRVLYDTNI